MSFQKLIALFNKLVAGAGRLSELSAEAEWDRLHSIEAFRALLERMRARADRTGGEFSLVEFSTRHVQTDDASLMYLVRTLKGHLRLSDEAGRLDRHSLGVVLPSASAEDAWNLADRVGLHYPLDLPLPECKVYRYPTDWLSNKSAQAGEAKRPASEKKPVHAMEPLFARRTPTWKRCLDVTAAAAGLIALTPLFALVALSIKITAPGPVFFRQWRTGRGGRKFQLIKFRSMVVDAESQKQALMDRNEQDGPAFKIKHDPRITPLGRFLRATSIDELPQLWNVLVGDMSLVGPRPLPCHEAAACSRWQRRRLDVVPGLTCTWQVAGRSSVSFAEWMRMDLRYVHSRSLQKDLKLLLRTVPAVVFGTGS